MGKLSKNIQHERPKDRTSTGNHDSESQLIWPEMNYAPKILNIIHNDAPFNQSGLKGTVHPISIIQKCHQV